MLRQPQTRRAMPRPYRLRLRHMAGDGQILRQRFATTVHQASVAFSMRVERLIWEVLRVLHHLHHID